LLDYAHFLGSLGQTFVGRILPMFRLCK